MQRIAVYCGEQKVKEECSSSDVALHHVTACCSVLQCVAVCCSVLQCVAVS